MDGDDKRCLICNKDIQVKVGLLPPKMISIVGKTEPTIKWFAEIHIKNNNLKYVECAKRFLLTLSTNFYWQQRLHITKKSAINLSEVQYESGKKFLLVKLL